MQYLFTFSKLLFILIIYMKLNISNCECSIYNLSGIQYPKSFNLNNGKIIIVGTSGIYIFDSTGTVCLDENPINEDKITSANDHIFTTFAQFERGEKYVIILVKHVIYILNSDGIKQFKVKLTHEINTEMGYYSIVPFIDENNNYNFFLGLLGKNTQNKPIIQYFSINLEGESFTLLYSYTFDSDDSIRAEIKYDMGISCQLMNHMSYGNVLTCFYHNYRNPQEIGCFSFKLENNQILKIPMINATYNDQSFSLRSMVSQDKKKSLLCYIRNNGDYNDRTGYCSIFSIDENKFLGTNKYLSRICGNTNNNINLNFFKETREYVFTCSGDSDVEINFAKLDENFNRIEILQNKYDTNILVTTNCQNLNCYSITFSSSEYRIVGQLQCNGETNINIFGVSEDLNPSIIYSDSPEIENIDESPSYLEISNQKSSENPENLSYQEISNQESSENLSYKEISNPENSSNSQEENQDILTISDTTHSLDNSDYMSSTNTEILISSNDLDSESTSITSNNCQYYKNNEGTICSEKVPDGYYILDLGNKIIEKCHKSCKTCEKGPNNNNINCLSCFENYELNSNNNCIYKFNYYYDKTIETIIYLLENQLCPEKLPYEIIETKECVETCSNEEFINNKCKVNYYSENNMDLITNKLRSLVMEINNSTCDVVIEGNNIVYEITTTKTNNEHHNISSINFGECEAILKKHYSLDYLLVFKIDVKINDSYPTYVDYEVYSPIDKKKLDLSLCEETQIEVSVPITNLDDFTKNQHNSMNKYGIDIFDKNNSFYNDICTPFTSEDGTDMLLSDRKTNYYNENITLCENGCIYKSYNNTNGKATCQCQVKSEITDIKTISYEKLDVNTFFDIKSFSNIELIKCFKLTFSKNGLLNNYGSMLIFFMTLIFISLIILYNIKKKTSVSRIIRLALKINNIEYPPRRKSLNIHFSAKTINDKNDLNKLKDQRNQNKPLQSQTIRHLIEANDQSKQKIPKRKSIKKLTVEIRSIENLNLIHNQNYILNENEKKSNIEENKKYTTKISRKTVSRKSVVNEISVYPIKQVNDNKITERGVKKKVHKEKYNDLELNNLEYKEAIKNDKRTYMQYYCSLIKIKHIILCIFFSSYDYNLTSIKISLFIFTFCLYFTVSALFFTDKTMHKIYEDKGIFNLAIHLPQIFFSTLISTFLNILIKKLALSEKNMMELKKIKNKEKALQKSVKLYRFLMIKFNLYYFISLLFIIFFWYYISTFCAVYKNTQIILIESTMTSFSLTLIYPFALNLLPGIFRIPALKASKRDKENLYKIGNIIALI